MKVIKTSNIDEEFNIEKLAKAIHEALGDVSDTTFKYIVESVLAEINSRNNEVIKTSDINDIVEQTLIKNNLYNQAKAFIINRYEKKKGEELESKAQAIIQGVDSYSRSENANKNIDVVNTQRDYVAGITCKSYFEKNAPKEVIKAHKAKIIHFHDTDYSPLMPMWNCDLLNVEDAMTNGFMMADTWISSPKSFSTACNLLAQISLIVSGEQYGGQTISWAHVAKYVEATRIKVGKMLADLSKKLWIIKIPFIKNTIADYLIKQDVITGIKTYQYQIICHQSSNGQTPFVSNCLCLREAQTQKEMDDLALIIEHIFLRRIDGVRNERGQSISPLFPKLLYFICPGLNEKPGDKYYYLTKLAAKCISVRCQPDINSEKLSRQIKSGQIIPSMGCRSWLAPSWKEIVVDEDTKFYWQIKSDKNITYEGAPGANINYEEPINYDTLPKDNYPNIIINMRGNSAWVKEYNEERHKFILIVPHIYGRFNSGVVTLNLPYIALLAKKKIDNNDSNSVIYEKFFKELDKYMLVARQGLTYRTDFVKKIHAKTIPLLLKYGLIARMKDEETVNDWINRYPKAMSTSFGLIGLYETVLILFNSKLEKSGVVFAEEILKHMNEVIAKYAEEDKLNYSLYGTPEENLTTQAAEALKKKFGIIEGITDKDYVVNSYHIDPRVDIPWNYKLAFEAKMQKLCKGGSVSYIEVYDLTQNLQAIEKMISFMAENIYYSEINRLISVCYTCGGNNISIIKNGTKFNFKCEDCGETNESKLSVIGRICGYLGKITNGNTSNGRLDDIYNRKQHID